MNERASRSAFNYETSTMNTRNALARALAFLAALAPAPSVMADPCGMVPPIWLGEGTPIRRVGVQKTYVFYKDGMESIVLRPGFEGKVEEFGMLIPFPSPPELRKVADDVFPHVAAAIDPPEVVIDLQEKFFPGCCDMEALGYSESNLQFKARRREVTVLKQEAVGMYEVAVLDAGSVQALQGWMDDHDFRFPEGMEDTCQEYIEEGWCFVAVKARVGDQSATQPRPGMRDVDAGLPLGASFDGHVQAMGFRFWTDEIVVPMRLSAFNEGDLHNVVYVLSDTPQRVANLSADLVVRQVPGTVLFRNVSDPLPLRVLGGSLKDISDWRLEGLPRERDPNQHNGIARDLFASDLMAARTGRLSHELEEREKELLDIGERLGLRGPEIDAFIAEALREEREALVAAALADLQSMTLSVIDGDFARDVIAAENLSFTAFRMADEENRCAVYDAKHFGPPPAAGGFLSELPPPGPLSRFVGLFTLAVLVLLGIAASRRLRRRRSGAVLALGAGLVAVTIGSSAQAQAAFCCRVAPTDGSEEVEIPEPRGQLERLLSRAREAVTIEDQGWAIVTVAEIGDERAEKGLEELANTSSSGLVRAYAQAARIRLARSPEDLARLTPLSASHPVLVRPLKQRWLGVLQDPEIEKPLATILAALSSSWPLQQELLPMLQNEDEAKFVEVMFHAKNQNARNLAAGMLAAMGNQEESSAAELVLRALDFDTEATRVPWHGGPLFLPGLAWTKEDAGRLMRRLVSWHLFCNSRGLKDEKNQIHNNLNSLALANQLGYQLPGRADTATWLTIYGETFGRAALARLILEQDPESELRWKRVLRSLDD